MKRTHSAFTLIELLVVIAIIAILAAILFPVFAQAKAAAKGTVALSDAKQMALGQLMYMSDNEDQFSPISAFPPGDVAGNFYPFSFLQQPYMKSWGVVMDPLSPATVNDDPLKIQSQWAMPPRLVDTTSIGHPEYFTMGHTSFGKAFTGNKLYYYDGIAGVAKDATVNDWAAWHYNVGNTPSLSQTSVNNPSDQVMIVTSATFDMEWQFADWGYTADFYAPEYWAAPELNLYGDAWTICGPQPRVHGAGIEAGVGAVGSTAQPLPLKASVIYCAVDGHAKQKPWSQLMGTTTTLPNGNIVIKALWPSP